MGLEAAGGTERPSEHNVFTRRVRGRKHLIGRDGPWWLGWGRVVLACQSVGGDGGELKALRAVSQKIWT